MSEANAPLRNDPELTVSELANGIKRALEAGFSHVRLRGEVFGYRGPHSSGHSYFALKDEKAKIDAVVWRGVFDKLRFKPEEGMEVIVTGKVTTYPGSSKYQIVVDSLEPAGAGALMALLEERKKKLTAEGLFDESRKRKLPFLPRVVGIITSPTGAVIRDMLAGFTERFPTRVLIWPVRVQGETSAAEVAAAIRGFNRFSVGGPFSRPDVLIVARGGGSLEDLWGFNEEAVVRAVAESEIPLISAVGHETDWTLIDLAADARAPTPTKAAEWAVPKYSELLERLSDFSSRLTISGRRQREERRRRLTDLSRAMPRPAELVGPPRQRFDAAAGRLGRALRANTESHKTRAARVGGRLNPSLPAARIARASDRLAAAARAKQRAYRPFLEARRARLQHLAARATPQAIRVELRRGRERLGELARRSTAAIRVRINERFRLIGATGQLLSSLSYESALQRGYALVRSTDGRMLRRAAEVPPGMRLDIQLSDGHVEAEATSGGSGPPAPVPRPKAKPGGPTSGSPSSGGQGSLL